MSQKTDGFIAVRLPEGLVKKVDAVVEQGIFASRAQGCVALISAGLASYRKSTILRQRYPNLDALFNAIKSGELDEMGDAIDWSELPIYGDETWNNPTEIWSWDWERAIVGTCSEDMHLVPLSEIKH